MALLWLLHAMIESFAPQLKLLISRDALADTFPFDLEEPRREDEQVDSIKSVKVPKTATGRVDLMHWVQRIKEEGLDKVRGDAVFPFLANGFT
eukprot:128484-Prorocentrum_lima.AAC.1